MLVIAILIRDISLLRDIMNLLLEVLDPFKKFGCFFFLNQSMGRLQWRIWNGQSYINGGQWIETQAHLKRVVANRVVEGSLIATLNKWEPLAPCT
jgi:hypothetical protein